MTRLTWVDVPWLSFRCMFSVAVIPLQRPISYNVVLKNLHVFLHKRVWISSEVLQDHRAHLFFCEKSKNDIYFYI